MAAKKKAAKRRTPKTIRRKTVSNARNLLLAGGNFTCPGDCKSLIVKIPVGKPLDLTPSKLTVEL